MMRSGIWSEEEHDRFLFAIKQYPNGPWAAIAEAVGTRSVRQVQTHTQKYYEKIMRRMRGIRKERKTWARLEHRIEDDILEFCKIMHSVRTGGATGHPNGNGPNHNSAANVRRTDSIKRSNSPVGSSQPASPIQQLTDDVMIKMEEEIEAAGFDSGDDLDYLPSLEESLDFFIASLECGDDDVMI